VVTWPIYVYKLPTEPVLKYDKRIKDLRTALIDTSRRQGRNIDKLFFEEIDAKVLEAFTNSLPSELIVRMEHQAIDNFQGNLANSKSLILMKLYIHVGGVNR